MSLRMLEMKGEQLVKAGFPDGFGDIIDIIDIQKDVKGRMEPPEGFEPPTC